MARARRQTQINGVTLDRSGAKWREYRSSLALLIPDNQLKVAALVDLASMKAATVPHRAEAKDYLDLDAMLAAGTMDLPTTLTAAKVIYGRQFNAQLPLKALVPGLWSLVSGR